MSDINKACKKAHFTIAFHGDREVGKSSIMKQLKLGRLAPGHRYEEHISVDGIDVYNWNIGGRELMSPIWRERYKTIDGFVYVIDGSDKTCLDTSVYEDTTIIWLHFKILSYEETENTVIMVLVNKQDVEDAITPEQVEEDIRRNIAEDKIQLGNRCVFVRGCSAKTREGLEEAFSLFFDQVCLRKAGKTVPGLMTSLSQKREADEKSEDGMAQEGRDRNDEQQQPMTGLQSLAETYGLESLEQLRDMFLRAFSDESIVVYENSDDEEDFPLRKRKVKKSKIHSFKKFVKSILLF